MPGGLGQFAGQCLGGDHGLGLLFLAVVVAPALRIVLTAVSFSGGRGLAASGMRGSIVLMR
jgi:hypothetical protein